MERYAHSRRGVEMLAHRVIQETLSSSVRRAPDPDVRVEPSYATTGLGSRVVNNAATRPARASFRAGHGLFEMREAFDEALLAPSATCRLISKVHWQVWRLGPCRLHAQAAGQDGPRAPEQSANSNLWY
jgi:hypothetical protein